MTQIKKTSSYTIAILAVLSFIPIVGGIIGLVLLIRWLFFLRDKWFLIIGASGLLFTVAFLFYMEYLRRHRGIFDESKILFAQKNMERVVKEIEFYKLNNNMYPKQLQDLDIQKYFLIDPLQEVNPNLSPYFYYEPKGEKYYFFSKGFDGIAFTNDDLFPVLKNMKVSNLGLIIPDSVSLKKN